MCVSQLLEVLAPAGPAAVWAAGPDGARRRVSLLAFDQADPEPGTWLVCHSGYALSALDRAEAAETLAALAVAAGPDQDEEVTP